MVNDEELCVNLGFVKLSCTAATPFTEVKVMVVPTGNCVCGLNDPELPAAKAVGCESTRAVMMIAAATTLADIFVDVRIFRFTS